MTEQQRASRAQARIQGDPKALDPKGWDFVQERMRCLPAAPTRREELLLKVRMTALECASRTTPDLDPEVTLQTADEFVRWICEGR